LKIILTNIDIPVSAAKIIIPYLSAIFFEVRYSDHHCSFDSIIIGQVSICYLYSKGVFRTCKIFFAKSLKIT
jgi:hypothetical protein